LEPFATIGESKAARKKGIDESELLAIPESLQGLGPETFGLETRGAGAIEFSSDEEEEYDEDEQAELDDDCYFPKDGYNYNQHLRTVSSEKKRFGGVVIEAPKKVSVIGGTIADEKTINIQQPTNQEEEELRKALDDAELYEELDEEDLDEMLPEGGIAELGAEVLWGPSAVEDQVLPDLAIFKAMHAQRLASAAGQGEDSDDDEEHCEGVPGADDGNFDQLLEDEYGDEEDGALDDEEIEGHIGEEKLEEVVDEYLEETQKEKELWDRSFEPQEQKLCDCPRVIDETKAIIARHYEVQDEADEETSEGESETDDSKNWDCETVLSTLSNVSNRPGKINKIKLAKAKPTKELAAITEDGSDEEEEDDAVELPDVILERPKYETPEEKKARKAGVKEMRRICRKMKKESKEMYKNEAQRLAAMKGGSDVRQGLRLNKL
jgi:protein LTV1